MRCKLEWGGTLCLGKTLNRCLENRTFIVSCERHYQIFNLLKELRQYDVPVEELHHMSPEKLIDRLRELRKADETKLLGNENVPKDTEGLV